MSVLRNFLNSSHQSFFKNALLIKAKSFSTSMLLVLSFFIELKEYI